MVQSIEITEEPVMRLTTLHTNLIDMPNIQIGELSSTLVDRVTMYDNLSNR